MAGEQVRKEVETFHGLRAPTSTRVAGPKDLGRPKIKRIQSSNLWPSQIFGAFHFTVQGFKARILIPGILTQALSRREREHRRPFSGVT